jgi:hypothetical protein
MTHGISEVHVIKTGKGLAVRGMGKTPTGQKYIRGQEVLKVKSIADPKFKSELSAALDKLFE